MNKSVAFAITALAFLGLAFLLPVNAQYGQYGQYGAPSAAQTILIDKLVGTGGAPTKGGGSTTTFVDNLSPSDARFKSGDTVVFQIKVKNTADSLLSGVEITDTLPSSLELIDGAALRADGVAVIHAGDFKPNEEKVYTIKARVKSQDKLAKDRGVFCEVNKARAAGGNVADEDTAQFCIEKQVAGVPGAAAKVEAVPQAGPEMGLLILGGQLSMLGAGLYLRRRST